MAIILKCFFTTGLIATSLAINAQKACSTEEYQEDLDTLKKWVEEVHPWPFSRCTEDEWDSAFVSVGSSLDSGLSSFGFSKKVGEILGILKDSHTTINFEHFQDITRKSNGVLKIRFKYLNGRFYVFKDSNNIVPIGSEVSQINNTPIEDYFNSALTYAPMEGNSYTSKVRIAELLIPDFVNTDLDENSTSVEIEDVDGKVYDYPISEKEIEEEEKRIVEWVWPEGNERVVTLKIPSFYKGKDVLYYRDLNKGFKRIKKDSYNKLVIDLRGNFGGDAYRMEYLLHLLTHKDVNAPSSIVIKQCAESKENFSETYKGVKKFVIDKLGKNVDFMQDFKRIALLEIGQSDTLYFETENPKLKHTYKSDVCLLIDGTSASATVSFTSNFNKLNRGFVVGESCMGPSTGTFGNPISRQLPNSEISVNISSIIFHLDSSFKWLSNPISPNRFIQWSQEDMVNGDDPHEAAIEDWVVWPKVSNKFNFEERESQILFSELETIFSDSRAWGGDVRKEIFETIVEFDGKISDLNSKIKKFERSDLSEDEILENVMEVNRNKKVSVSLRNATINLQLPVELRSKFEELIAPNRPAVLHFGIHNRADCNVCKI
ncbi:MAG: hypothetical protein CMB32_04805 [Euryarchaeota archaeon]|nr:hypothetical protein [Euryarchaeota archaeon]|tara:strand:+ start:2218 stop:4023 length:1806 start_codon:yes stop_codon:yes gene_type:complete